MRRLIMCYADMLKISLYTLSLVIINLGRTAEGNQTPCPTQVDKANYYGQLCEQKSCVPGSDIQNEMCGGRRVCSCDGYCGYRCIKVLQEAYCPQLQVPANAQVQYDSDRHQAFNTIANFSCNDRSVLTEGNLTRTCRGDGTWSGNEPLCYNEAEACPRKQSAITDTNRVCQPTCSLHEGPCSGPGETCECDGVCGMTCVRTGEPNYCETLPEMSHVSISYNPENRVFGTKATFSCDQGYVKESGDETRTCGGDRNWSSGQNLVCARFIFCSANDRPPVDNSDVEDKEKDIYMPGEYMFYRCNYGYYRDGMTHILCQDNGIWTQPELICRIKSCPTPPIPENGGRIENVFSFGSTVTITCNHGYRMIGLPYRTCQGNQEWSGYEPECVPVECPKLYPPANGIIFPEDRYTFRTDVEIECNEGFILEGSQTRQCQGNKQWSGELSSCRPVNCKDPGTPPNGQKLGNDYGYSDVVYFRCNENFELKGSQSTRCTGTEAWTEDLPQCIGFCTLPAPPANGRYPNQLLEAGSRIDDGEVVDIECNEGYQLPFDGDWFCDGVGTHMSPVAECIESPCEKFHLSETTIYIYNNEIEDDGVHYASGTTVRMTCINDNYQLIENSAQPTICERGFWRDEDTFAKCEPKPCAALPSPANGRIQYKPDVLPQATIQHGFQAEYICDDGYEIVASQQISVCQYGNWNNSVAVECDPAGCQPLPGGGPISYSVQSIAKFPHQSTGTYTGCDQGYVLQGNGINTCKFGTWKSGDSSEPSTCAPVQCRHRKPVNYKVKYYRDGQEIETISPSHGMMRIFSCVDGFVIEGNNGDGGTCDNGDWNRDPPKCNGESCDPYPYSAQYSVGYLPYNRPMGGKYEHGIVAKITCRSADYQPTVPGGNTTCYGGRWSYDITCQRENLALRKTASQSSEVQDYSPASRAVDGNTSPLINHNSCTHTRNEPKPWWHVDLGHDYTINSITLVNTNDNCCKKRLAGAVIRVGRVWREPLDFTGHVECGTPVTTKEAKSGQTITRTCNSGTIGRYVSVQLQKSERLQLCEVMVFGEAPNGCFVPSIRNGVVKTQSNEVLNPNELFNKGTSIYFHCNEGYSRSGSHYNTCENDGSLRETNPTCDPSPCEVRYLNYGQIERSKINHRDTVQYSCYRGYEKLTEGVIRCEYGTLVPMEHACVRPQCDIPPLPANMIPRGTYIDNKVKHNSYLTVMCEAGYTLGQGRYFIKCNAGQWLNEIDSTCIRATSCSKPVNPNHGHFELQGSTVRLLCDQGYQASHSWDAVCNEGQWTNLPTCEIVLCSEPTNPSHGHFDLHRESSFFQGSTVRLVCNPGYGTSHSQDAVCLEGQWTNLPTCEIDLSDNGDFCEYPNLDCGLRIFSDGTEIHRHIRHYLPHRTQITLAYPSSYVETSICNNGDWLPEVIACNSCNRPPVSSVRHPLTVIQTVVGEGILTDSSPSEFPVGTVIEARCGDIGKARLVPPESVRRVCSSRGWTGENPTCENVYTKLLFKGKYNVRQVKSDGTVVIQQDYGGLMIYCDYEDSLWRPTITGPQDSRYGSRYYGPTSFDLNTGDVHIYDLGRPYPRYSGRYTCTYGQHQHYVDIEIKDVRCSDPGRPVNGWRSGTDFNIKKSVTFGCYNNLVLYGESTITCNLGQWSAPTPTCRPSGCEPLTTPQGVTVRGGGSTIGAQRLFECPAGYSTQNGESRVLTTCGEDGNWSRQPPICSVEQIASVPEVPAVDPCESKTCEEWQKCSPVNGEAKCFCMHPQECPYSKIPTICGTDGQNYTSLCNLMTISCYFDKDVEKELDTPCPPLVEAADEYSLNSYDDLYSIDYVNQETPTTTPQPPTEGSIDFGHLPIHIQPDTGSDQVPPNPFPDEVGSEQILPPQEGAGPGCTSEECQMRTVEQACQNASVALVVTMKIDVVTGANGIFALEIVTNYWGNVTGDILAVVNQPEHNGNCFCPNFDMTSDDNYIIISQSPIIDRSIILNGMDYVALLTDHRPLSEINECQKN